MRIAVLGGGPAGLYFSALWKNRHPRDEVTLFEQNPRGSTFGFGVVFSDRAMDFLRADDPATADAITARMETWSNMTIVHRGERIAIDELGFSAIGRLDLLQLFQRSAELAGVELRFETVIDDVSDLDGFDLIVVADGVNSIVRRAHADVFQTSITHLDEKFAWFGTTKPFETLTQTFIETEHGPFNAHHYRYQPGMSTFIVECDSTTWQKAGFHTLGEEASRAACEPLFAGALDGHGLIANKSLWRNFPWVWSERWFHRNIVLMGDALHTAHYSIGSGTRLALEDVLALVTALEAHPGNNTAAFEAYESARKPIVQKLVTASKTSAAWYAKVPGLMHLSPLDLAYSYIKRSGRIDDERLSVMSPAFMAQYDAHRAATSEVAA